MKLFKYLIIALAVLSTITLISHIVQGQFDFGTAADYVKDLLLYFLIYRLSADNVK